MVGEGGIFLIFHLVPHTVFTFPSWYSIPLVLCKLSLVKTSYFHNSPQLQCYPGVVDS